MTCPERPERPARFVVVCDDYRTPPMSQTAAERRLATIEQAGECRLPHRVEQVER